jgi:hypothetical protein
MSLTRRAAGATLAALSLTPLVGKAVMAAPQPAGGCDHRGPVLCGWFRN